MPKWLCALIIATLVFAASSAVAKNAKPMTNQDVINLVQAKISQDSILMAIENSKTDFDTSSSALIELNKRGVPDAVVQAMMRADEPKQAVAPASTKSAPAHAGSLFNPEEVTLLDGPNALRCTISRRKSAPRRAH